MSEPIQLRIDEPEDHTLRNAVSRVRGWCTVADVTGAAELELRIGDARIPWQSQARPDVNEKYPNTFVIGFICDVDLSQYLYAIRSAKLTLTADIAGAPETEILLSVASGITAKCLAAAAGV